MTETEVRTALSDLNGPGSSGSPLFLFRGQTEIHDKVQAFIGRIEDTRTIGISYTVLKWMAGRLRAQVPARYEAVAPTADEVIALMQHYGWPTPFIDVTDSVDVAIFFAKFCADGSIPSKSIVYAVDLKQFEATTPECRHVAHDDVVDPELNLRWTRQRGHSLAAAGWPNMEHVRAIDLLALPGTQTFVFKPDGAPSEAERSYYLPGLDATGIRLRELVRIFAKDLGFEPLPEALAKFPH